ncbi:hypothetical protein CPB85DRAFT_1567421 [Mucidula mucida]|nr:hypothetical protein CPB85DRAFT_1567421 [Mucidula mucida]
MRSPSFSSLMAAMVLVVAVPLLFVNAAPSSSILRRAVSKLPEGTTPMQIQLRKKAGATEEEPAHLVRSKTKQGNNAIVFDVVGGWTIGKTKKAAIAKTTADGGEMKKEAAVLNRVDQLYAYGQEAANDRHWIIMPDVTKGSTPLYDLEDLLQVVKPKTAKACEDIVDKAVVLTAAAAKKWAKAARVVHLDLHPGNVFFDKKMTQAELVDWGSALDYDEMLKDSSAEDLDETIESTAKTFFQQAKDEICAKIK